MHGGSLRKVVAEAQKLSIKSVQIASHIAHRIHDDDSLEIPQ
jgi:hypothetical protein